MTFKINIPWRDYQKETLRGILGSPKGTIHVIKSPRQCGKTTLLEALLLSVTISNPNACSIIVEPTNKQCKKVFRELKKSVEGTPICSTTNESTLDITFTNGSQIIFISGESDISSAQGFTCKNGGVLIIDEGAYIQDDMIHALTPTTDVHKAKIILASTPLLRYGLFYDYYITGLSSNSEIYCYNWSGYTLLSQERLEFYRKKLPSNTFKNYYLGEFTDFGSGVFGDISSCISNDFKPLYKPNNPFQEPINCVMGIDWGTGSEKDDTCITIFNTLKQMMYIEKFNNLDETQTIERIIELVKTYDPIKIKVEMNSIGKIFYGLLNKRLKEINYSGSYSGFNTTNESKNRIVNKFQIAIQSKEVQILNNEELLYQLNTFESKPSSTGKITYAAAKNGHDDMVMATLIAFDCLSSGKYNIS